MRQYELTVLIHPDLEMNVQPALDKIQKFIDEVGGKVTKETNEGKKRLAYKIAKQEFAVYYYYELDLENKAAAKKLASNLDIADEVIRHLLVTVDENRLKFEAECAKHKPEDENEDSEEDGKTTSEDEKDGKSSKKEQAKDDKSTKEE